MKPKTKYIGLTIGPIIDIISQAKKTRQMWGYSYIFSYITSRLVKGLEKDSFEIVLPHAPDDLEPNGAGIYPDRIIAIAPKDKGLDEVKKVAAVVLDELSKKIDIQLYDKANSKENAIKEYLQKTFYIFATEMDLTEDSNLFAEVSNQLNAIEYTPNCYTAGINYLEKFIESINKDAKGESESKINFLLEDAFGKDHQQFKSIIEVSASNLARKNETGFKGIVENHFRDKKSKKELSYNQINEFALIAEIRGHNDFKNHYRDIYKYAVIGYADGDGIGQLLKETGAKKNAKEELIKLSKKLSNFSKEASNKINDFGGMTIYAGGDDLFFFAPVLGMKGNSLQDIVSFSKDLDDLFQSKFKTKDKANCPTLSFGLDIIYFKSPLDRAIKDGYEKLLSHRAKGYKDDEEKKHELLEQRHGNKNTIALSFTSHSGQSSNVDLELGNKELFKTIMVDFVQKFGSNVSSRDAKDSDNFFTGYSRKMLQRDAYFRSFKPNDKGGTSYSLLPFFKNQKEKPSKNEGEDFIEQSASMVSFLYNNIDNDAAVKESSTTALLEFAIKYVQQLRRTEDQKSS